MTELKDLEITCGTKKLTIEGQFDSDEEVYMVVEDTWNGNEVGLYAMEIDLEKMYEHLGKLLGK